MSLDSPKIGCFNLSMLVISTEYIAMINWQHCNFDDHQVIGGNYKRKAQLQITSVLTHKLQFQ